MNELAFDSMKQRSRRALGPLAIAFALAACGTTSTGYDPNAMETLGLVIERTVHAENVKQGTTAMSQMTVVMVSGVPILVPMMGATGPNVTVFSHRLALNDGRNITVLGSYPNYDKGTCVKLFESPRPSYPRMVLASGCKPH
jgi:hypothetical protein